jgi:hypothetical protein
MKRRSLILGSLAAWCAARPTRAATTPDESWFDASRSRALPLRLRWPAGDTPCAAVLYSHGLGGSRDGGEVWGEAWRQAGFMVAHVQHPGSDIDTVRRQGLRGLRAAASGEQLLARVDDMRFVLDEVERRARAGQGPWSRLRGQPVGAAGHSFGAHTTQALAGQRYANGASLGDERFKAFIGFSPSPGRGRAQRIEPAAAFGAVARPFLCVTGSNDENPLGDERTGDHRLAVYDGLPSGRRALLWLDGADHITFGGNAARAGLASRAMRRAPQATSREPDHHALVAQLTTAWWQAHLQSDAAAREALREPTGLGAADRWRSD